MNHIDGNPQNNYYSNLEWTTQSENMQHAFRTGLMNQRGNKNNRAKLTFNKAEKIRLLYKSGGYTKTKLGEMYGVSDTAIRYIVTNKNWLVSH